MTPTVVPAWAWKNPPEPPVRCETCGAVAGARCTVIGSERVLGKVHKSRAIEVALHFDRRDRAYENVADIALYRARRAMKPKISTAK